MTTEIKLSATYDPLYYNEIGTSKSPVFLPASEEYRGVISGYEKRHGGSRQSER